ncbi:glycoside hydrolase family 32 protein, partial [Liquorilactobacillus vini]|uniref:glycoside hydrolase family 32 protein n=1 Tax=Liquorilactobacillus vini TaxID=238015 RepID=UPI0003128FD4
MWECPDYFELNGQGILLFSPQGLQPQGEKYQNIYQTGCFIGQPLDYQNLKFEHGPFQELDAGFDFYATQTFLTPDKRRILYGWFGISEIEYPTVKYHYSGCLTVPRELTVKNGQLYQQPARELQTLRSDPLEIDQHVSQKTELSVPSITQEFVLQADLRDCQQLVLDLKANSDDTKYTRLIIDKSQQVCRLTREQSGISFAEKYGQTRSRHFEFGDHLQLQILIDTSSVEIFLQGGEVVFSARIFPAADQKQTFVTSYGGQARVRGTAWNLKGATRCLDS